MPLLGPLAAAGIRLRSSRSGEEFVLLLSDTHLDGALLTLERLQQAGQRLPGSDARRVVSPIFGREATRCCV